MLPGTIEERRQLVLDIMDQVNFYPKVFEHKHCYILGLLIHTLTDPRKHESLALHKGTRVITAIKKNPELWNRVSPFTQLATSFAVCKCRHNKLNHKDKGECRYILGYGSKSKLCKCKHFVQETL